MFRTPYAEHPVYVHSVCFVDPVLCSPLPLNALAYEVAYLFI